MNEFLRMDLQLFNDGLIGEGVEDDDPTVQDEVIESVSDDDDGVDLASLVQVEEPEEEPEEEPVEEPEPEPEEAPPANGKFYTQAEIDAIISSRLQREREKYAGLESTVEKVKNLEKAAGMTFDEILDQVKAYKVQAYVDEGMSEEAAQRLIEMEMKHESLEERLKRSEAYIQNRARSDQYFIGKQAVINSNPLYRKFEREIDEFAQYGNVLSFDDAAKYVIGDKVARGELLDDIRKGAEAKALAKKGANIESGSQPGGRTRQPRLSYEERQLARGLGLTDEEWLDGKRKMKKR